MTTHSTKKVYLVRWVDRNFPASNGIRKICATSELALKHAREMLKHEGKMLDFRVEPWEVDCGT